MSDCHSEWHPQVPVTVVTVSVVFCHQCVGFGLSYSLYTQDVDVELVEIDGGRIEYGPFDQVEDVTAAACAHLKGLLLAPGRPWDTGRYDYSNGKDS